METNAQIDIFILILIFLSVFIGYSRGFCAEILQLLVYVFSGVTGYFLIPVFQPFFYKYIPHGQTSSILALISGAVLAWIFFRLLVSSLIRCVKDSRFKRLDSTLGMLFGLFRAAFFLCFFTFLINMFSASFIQQSKLLKLSFIGVERILKEFPELQINLKEKDEDAGENPDASVKKEDSEQKDGSEEKESSEKKSDPVKKEDSEQQTSPDSKTEKKEDLNQKNFILKYMTPVDENNQESFMSIFSSFLKYFGITMEGTPDQPVIPAVEPDTKKDGEDQTKKEMEARDLQEKGK